MSRYDNSDFSARAMTERVLLDEMRKVELEGIGKDEDGAPALVLNTSPIARFVGHLWCFLASFFYAFHIVPLFKYFAWFCHVRMMKSWFGLNGVVGVDVSKQNPIKPIDRWDKPDSFDG